MKHNLIAIGLAFILIGFALVFFGALFSSSNSKVAVGGFLGPIPFGFANDKRLLYWVMGLTALVFVLWWMMRGVR